MTHSPPSSAAGLKALSREQAAAAFARHHTPEEWLRDKARLAILSPPGLIVSASPSMLALFGAKDFEALEARLVRAEGPSARRLRHLAATLPIGEPSRLEQMRLAVDRRRIGVNLRCVRTAGPGGATWLLVSVPALGAASGVPPALAEAREAPPPEDITAPDLGEKPGPHGLSTPSPNARFLWTLDEEGRFGMVHPVLVAAVGANAPEHGESIETLFRRVRLDRGDELTRVLGERETFSRVAVEWPVSGFDRRRLIALSAAPMFGRQREFLGYRGFGVLGEEIEVVAVPEASEPALSRPTSELEAEVRPSEDAAVESRLEFPPAENAGASQAFLGANESEPALTEAFEREASSPLRELEAEVQAPEKAPKTVEPTLEPPAANTPNPSPPEASLEADGTHSAPSLTEASHPDAPSAETAQPDLTERSAASELQPAPPGRTAAIYVLRHPSATASSNIVPIRPGALNSLARETAPSFPAESVELSRSERDAFREIARALVGRAPASRDEPLDERAGADSRRALGIDASAEQPTDRQARRRRRR